MNFIETDENDDDIMNVFLVIFIGTVMININKDITRK
jgi:hypothetical protein